ncbi:hypothetical protein SUDANB6_04102 [Streptomyces sp. enrichment culture]|uniref:hypothetical protein n=1 Tax=Streptomyces sp. enrichment culture TaxID=1795815 RepID=UPI003F576C7B
MSEHTPSQAEGDRDDEQGTAERQSPPHPTPSQAEGDRDDDRPAREGRERGTGS